MLGCLFRNLPELYSKWRCSNDGLFYPNQWRPSYSSVAAIVASHPKQSSYAHSPYTIEIGGHFWRTFVDLKKQKKSIENVHLRRYQW